MKGVLLLSSALLLLVVNFSVSEGCSCILPHLQSQLCGSKMVIKVKILFKWETPDINADNFYVVQLQKIWKDDSGSSFSVGDWAIMTTCGNGACCGINAMGVGESWVHTASVNGMGFIRVGLCGYNRNWNSMTKKEKKNINKYLNNCDCENRFCWFCNDESCKGSIDGCKWYKFIDDEDYDSCRSSCQATNSYCYRNNSGKCGWKNSNALSACISQCSVQRCPLNVVLEIKVSEQDIPRQLSDINVPNLTTA